MFSMQRKNQSTHSNNKGKGVIAELQAYGRTLVATVVWVKTGAISDFFIMRETPLLSIGEMLEVLMKYGEPDIYDLYPTVGYGGDHSSPLIGLYWQSREEGRELARALWEAVKEVVKEKTKLQK
jgi:hypothetical protein